MDWMEVMRARHSVRQYLDKPLEAEAAAALRAEAEACSREGGLHLQLVTEEPKAFAGFLARYGRFSGVRNYIAVVGPKTAQAEEACGYYGERLVLLAQRLGLNTCWVCLTYSKVKDAYAVAEGEKLYAVIALGYGANQGTAHKSKRPGEVAQAEGRVPDWFKKGVDAALLAPTAVNQQKFKFILQGDKVAAQAGSGPHTRLDLGIVKYHFEMGAGRENFAWV